MKNSRRHIAAGVTVVALGALATVALASGESTPNDTSAGRSTPAVRTETVHRSAAGTAAPAPTAVHQRRGRGTDDTRADDRVARSADDTATEVHHGRGRDDAGTDDRGGRRNDDAGTDDRRGRGSDDVGVDNHGGRGRSDDGGGSDDHGGGHGRSGHDD